MSFSDSRPEELYVVAFNDEKLNSSSEKKLRAMIEKVTNAGHFNVVLDILKVREMYRIGLVVIREFNDLCTSEGGRLVVVVSGQPRGFFDMQLGLENRVESFATVEDAQKSF